MWIGHTPAAFPRVVCMCLACLGEPLGLWHASRQLKKCWFPNKIARRLCIASNTKSASKSFHYVPFLSILSFLRTSKISLKHLNWWLLRQFHHFGTRSKIEQELLRWIQAVVTLRGETRILSGDQSDLSLPVVAATHPGDREDGGGGREDVMQNE